MFIRRFASMAFFKACLLTIFAQSSDIFINADHETTSSSDAGLSSMTVMVYETNTDDEGSAAINLMKQIRRLSNVEVKLIGQGITFEGYGSKYAAVYPELSNLPPSQLVTILDGRDVLVNNPAKTNVFAQISVDEFRLAYEALTADFPDAVVISAEAQCCVSALTHAKPGDYYNNDGTRNVRSCAGGQANCLWNGDAYALPWETFMKERAIEVSSQSGALYDDVYLNAGLMTGTAANLMNLFESALIGVDEDDQAVLTGYMYYNPSGIVLDYGQTMFGNNRGGLGEIADGACVFADTSNASKISHRLVHSKTSTTPLFLHSPGKFFQCQTVLANQLGYTQSPSRSLLSSLGCLNYDECGTKIYPLPINPFETELDGKSVGDLHNEALEYYFSNRSGSDISLEDISLVIYAFLVDSGLPNMNEDLQFDDFINSIEFDAETILRTSDANKSLQDAVMAVDNLTVLNLSVAGFLLGAYEHLMPFIDDTHANVFLDILIHSALYWKLRDRGIFVNIETVSIFAEYVIINGGDVVINPSDNRRVLASNYGGGSGNTHPILKTAAADAKGGLFGLRFGWLGAIVGAAVYSVYEAS